MSLFSTQINIFLQELAAQKEKNARLKDAFGIGEDFVDGSSFTRNRDAIEKAEKEKKSYKMLSSGGEDESDNEKKRRKNKKNKKKDAKDKSKKSKNIFFMLKHSSLFIKYTQDNPVQNGQCIFHRWDTVV